MKTNKLSKFLIVMVTIVSTIFVASTSMLAGDLSQVQGITIRVLNDTIAADASIDIPIEVLASGSNGLIGAITAQVTYDQSVVVAESCTFAADFTGACNTDVAGEVRISVINFTGMGGDFTPVTITFTAVGNGGDSTALGLTVDMLSNANGSTLDFTSENGQITIDSDVPPTAVPPTAVPPTAVPPTNTPVLTATPITILPTNTPVPTVVDLPPTNAELIYVSSSTGGSVNGIKFHDEDILSYDADSRIWNLHFDGSDVGIGRADVNAFHILDNGEILLSLNVATSLSDVGSVDDSDILLFTPTTLGAATTGTWSLYFDGSDVGLSTKCEDIDGISVDDSGQIVISTLCEFSVPGVSGGDEDLLRFEPTEIGITTAGAWSLYFDGTDVALSSKNEDIWGVHIDSSNDMLHLSTKGDFSITGQNTLSGSGSDIFTCAPSSLGTTTDCSFELYWDGDSDSFGSEIVDAFSIAAPLGQINAAINFTVSEPGNNSDEIFDDIEEENDDIADVELFLPLVDR